MTQKEYKKEKTTWLRQAKNHLKSLQLALADSESQMIYHKKNASLLRQSIRIAKQQLKS